MKTKTYKLLTASAILLANLSVAKAEIRFLGHGHTDLSLNYASTNNTWDFHVGSDALGAEFAPDEVILKVKAAAQTIVPPGAEFSFLGTAGSPVWILPIVQNEEL